MKPKLPDDNVDPWSNIPCDMLGKVLEHKPNQLFNYVLTY